MLLLLPGAPIATVPLLLLLLPQFCRPATIRSSQSKQKKFTIYKRVDYFASYHAKILLGGVRKHQTFALLRLNFIFAASFKIFLSYRAAPLSKSHRMKEDITAQEDNDEEYFNRKDDDDFEERKSFSYLVI